MKKFKTLARLLVAMLVILLVGCGGGGAGSTSTSTSTTTTLPPPPPSLTISTSGLPTAVQGLAYSGTLSEQNGVAPFAWSVSSTTSQQLPAGLSLDPATGTVSGTPTSAGFSVVQFALTDSSTPPKTAYNNVTLNVAQPLTVQPMASMSLTEYSSWYGTLVMSSGGVPPYAYSVSQGSMPPGMRLDPTSSASIGAPIAVGSFLFTVTVRDSYAIPEVATQPVTITVTPFPLQFSYSFYNLTLVVNKPFSGNLYANGGTPPYTFQIPSGTLPPGLSLVDPATGLVTGTPTKVGGYSILPTVTDSTVPAATAYGPGSITVVAAALGRNDSPALATPLGNISALGSISPILDSTGSLSPDTDYYKLIAQAGATVHVETFAKRNNPNNPLDTVIELTDVNGGRLSTGCNQPGGTTTFTSVCLDDDISSNPHIQDSALDFKVPGTGGTQTFLLHVLDWSGSARPDMLYTLQVAGAVDLLQAYSISLSAILGKSYSQPFSYTGGSGIVTFTLTGGSLPPGLTISGATITGTPTTAGNYSFTVQAADQSTPPQQSTASLSLTVVNVLTISTTQVPNGMVGNPYSFQFTSSGGLSPINWSCNFPPPGLTFNMNGTLSGTPTQSGTYTMQVSANDAGFYPAMGQTATQTFTITIQ